MNRQIKDKRYLLHRIIFLSAGLAWSAALFLLMFWAVQDVKKSFTALILMEARSFNQQILSTRYWNASHGGVYVPVTPETQPNPYLSVPRRDVITKDGQRLTLINPAYMTRQLSEIARKDMQVQYRITSLNPIRPSNAAGDWEADALRSFIRGNKEYYSWQLPEEKGKQQFRYMAPLWTEKPCLGCHARQGYAEGDLRGGISITIPAAGILAARGDNIKGIMGRYSLVWLLGFTGIFLSFRMSEKEYQARKDLIDSLEKALREVKTLRGFIPICAACKKIRNDEGYWEQIEHYIHERTDAEFSHGICPSCMKELYPDFVDDKTGIKRTV